ncbi:hypothetical protein [Anaerocolumna sp. MB42-C2]|uniref:hypothetical protein n=1 Tax=Anaerocolumna sp. MB42-C2 TaxID=3070997 RepID=UPI0027DF3722|nr:hypothetical protein [Anaerocolumna sp. MB42-C2]WMJ85815.1 hypothetical protein RBU59_17310 [Anaerocolumna sp. MB42-C2]
MSIKIPKFKQTEWLIVYIMFITIFASMINSFIAGVHALYYTIDIANTLLFLNILYCKKYKELFKGSSKIVAIWICFFIGYAIFISIVKIDNVGLFLWAIRNNFRYYIFFFSCILWLKGNFKFFNNLIIANFVAVLFEYLILGKRQDWIGGIFGFIGGDVNAPLNIFLIVITTYSVIYYLNKRESFKTFILKTASSFLIAAIAELKIFYIEFAIILLFAVLITDFTIKKIIIVLAFVLGAVVSLRMLYIVMPELDPEFFSISHMYLYATSHKGYTGSGDMNRFNFLSQCNEILKTKSNMITGLGLGNCEVATNIGWYSKFFSTYSYTHYNWLSSTFMYLELGWIGIIMYFGLFILFFIKIIQLGQNKNNLLNSQICAILALMTIVLLFYNSSMRGDYAYLMFYALAIPFKKSNINTA